MQIFCFAALLLLAAYYSWMSRLNQFFFFGRTAPVDFVSGAEAQSIVRRYLLGVWLGFAVSMLFGLLLWRQQVHAFFFWPLLVQAVGFYFAFARAHGETGRLMPASEPRTAVEVPLTASATKVPSLAALVAPIVFAVVVFCASLVAVGGPLAQAAQTLDAKLEAHGAEFLFSFGTGLAAAGFLSVLIRQRARTRTPLAGNALYASMIATWAGALAMTAAITIALAGGTISRSASKTVLGCALAIVLAVTLFRIIAIRRFVPPAAEIQADDNWLWGLFYRNSNDPALFVQCRCGVGYTLNFGRALAWPLMAAYVVFLAFTLTVAGRH